MICITGREDKGEIAFHGLNKDFPFNIDFILIRFKLLLIINWLNIFIVVIADKVP